jgi:hypothetical protein
MVGRTADERDEPRCVAAASDRGFLRIGEQVGGVLADGLEHAEAGIAGTMHGLQEANVDEMLHRIERID